MNHNSCRTRFLYCLRCFAALCTAFLLCVTFITVEPVRAAQPNILQMRTDDNRDVRWELTADSVRADDSSQVFEAEGRVVLRRGNDFLKADFARYFAATGWIYLLNNVEISFDGTEIVAAEAEFDLRSKTGWLKEGQIFVGSPHMYFTGERIEKFWGDIYSFQNATVSACIGDSPAWSMAAGEAVVELDGYARLAWPQMQVKGQSVLAMPFFVIPIKEKRQTGFLVPEYGYSSRDGIFYGQGFFWAIDDEQDLTFNEEFMVKRGFMHSVEYRANPRSDQMAWARLDYLYDKQVVGHESEDPVNKLDGLIRTNHDRFWLRGMYDGYFSDPRWRLKMNLDITSDQNFLREFRRNSSGFDKTRSELFQRFGRDLNERDDMRTTQIQLLRDWDRVSFALSGRYDQDPRLEHGNAPYSSSTTPQRLPEVNLYLHRGSIVETLPVEVEASAQMVRFEREQGARGMRYDLYPRVFVPLTSEYGSVVLGGGLRQTTYATERTERIWSDSGDNTGDSRMLAEVSAQAMTELAGVYEMGSAPLDLQPDAIGQTRWSSIQHVIQPRMSYSFIQNDNQDNNPYYDSDDRISARNELTFSLVNILNRRREVVALKTAADGSQDIVLSEDYLEFLRFSLTGRYSFRELQRSVERDVYERRPIGDIRAELAVSPISFLQLNVKSDFSPYEGDFTQHDITANYSDSNWGNLAIGYNYRARLSEYNRRRPSDIETISISGTLNMWGNWYVGGMYRADMHLSQDVERRITVTYAHECFTLYFDYIKDYDDERFQLSFELLGLGAM